MIVMSGHGDASYFNDGARYNPETDLWIRIKMPTLESFLPSKQMVWTGMNILVWGLSGSAGLGVLLDPTTNQWEQMAPLPPSLINGRVPEALVWTGAEMIFWGGSTVADDPMPLFDGAIFTFP
jgi:N-acetylneuraminic acid mutarotase